MKNNLKNGLRVVTMVGFAFGLMSQVTMSPTYADSSGQPTIYGRTYGEWSAQWWKWAYAGPDGKNAVQDTTGEFCAENQPTGKVWFLAGSFGLTGVERTCTIPPNRALFYSPVNTVWTDCPDTPDKDVPDTEVRDILATFGNGGDPTCQITGTLDGASISRLRIFTVRTQSPKFTTILPEHNLVSGCPAPLPAGKTGRQISEGYWIMLPPLSPGEHTLTIHGAACDSQTGDVVFESGVTYRLTVLRGQHKDDD